VRVVSSIVIVTTGKMCIDAGRAVLNRWWRAFFLEVLQVPGLGQELEAHWRSLLLESEKEAGGKGGTPTDPPVWRRHPQASFSSERWQEVSTSACPQPPPSLPLAFPWPSTDPPVWRRHPQASSRQSDSRKVSTSACPQPALCSLMQSRKPCACGSCVTCGACAAACAGACAAACAGACAAACAGACAAACAGACARPCGCTFCYWALFLCTLQAV